MTTAPKRAKFTRTSRSGGREYIDELSQEAREQGFILQFSQVGMVIIPANKEGEPMTQEDLRHLSEEERQVSARQERRTA